MIELKKYGGNTPKFGSESFHSDAAGFIEYQQDLIVQCNQLASVALSVNVSSQSDEQKHETLVSQVNELENKNEKT